MLTPSHGGDRAALAALSGRSCDSLLDFSVNVRPSGAPDFLLAALWRAMQHLDAYPDPHAQTARAAVARALRLPASHVLPGNGSNALIHGLIQALAAHLEGLGRPAELHIVEPAFSEYAKAAGSLPVHRHFSPPSATAFTPDMTSLAATAQGIVFAANPGNPSGVFTSPDEWVRLFAARPDVFFVLDEAFIDYVGEAGSVIPLLRDNWPANVAVLRSLTKFYAVPGLRVGFMVAPPAVIENVQNATPEWSMNTLALAALQAMMVAPDDPAFADVNADALLTRETNARARTHLSTLLATIPGVTHCPSAANYVLFRAQVSYSKAATESGSESSSGSDPALRLAREHGIIIRDCANYAGLEATATHRWYRVAVRTESEHQRLCEALRSILNPAPQKTITAPRPKPALMLQGATSDAGKSVLTAAFCRIFRQDGLLVAPFKSQNMSQYGGNAGTDADGMPLEMSRAQIMQAQAAQLPPDIRMNPVMLKPCSHTGSRVVVMGRDTGHMHAKEYMAARPNLWPTITGAYDELAAEHDLMVLEGAGSPAEINLKHGDVVNMAMARHARARVILVGDIDRGGLYAAFLGTFLTFTPEERGLLLGFAVNRFRGDASLLAPAHQWLQARTGAPVLGVVPHISPLGLPEEDSLSGIGNTGATMELAAVDAALDRLADVVREAFDMRALYQALGL